MQEQLEVMLSLQDDMNTRVHPGWRDQGYAWHRAVWIECAEMLDHYGWKWWKKQSPDVEQVRLELIDIWHFGLSMLLLEKQSADEIAQVISAAESSSDGVGPFPEELEHFVAGILNTRRFDVGGFIRLTRAIDLSFGELYTSYVGKNVLNFFRQDNGYQDGSYRKLWGGREDNEHLVELARSLDSSRSDFKDQLYRALTERYESSAE
ncbi:dUTP diphosphatase [Proteobacteria bacterium 005FR1]|nr:dUTP diphosphatase [Proteobacteria bacterium 005FR1]